MLKISELTDEEPTPIPTEEVEAIAPLAVLNFNKEQPDMNRIAVQGTGAFTEGGKLTGAQRATLVWLRDHSVLIVQNMHRTKQNAFENIAIIDGIPEVAIEDLSVDEAVRLVEKEGGMYADE